MRRRATITSRYPAFALSCSAVLNVSRLLDSLRHISKFAWFQMPWLPKQQPLKHALHTAGRLPWYQPPSFLPVILIVLLTQHERYRFPRLLFQTILAWSLGHSELIAFPCSASGALAFGSSASSVANLNISNPFAGTLCLLAGQELWSCLGQRFTAP